MEVQADFLNYNKIYTPSQIYDFLVNLDTENVIKNNKKVVYYNIPCAFDIETSSFYNGSEKVAIMYAWTLSILGHIIMGRTWDEFKECIDAIEKYFELGINKRLIIYVHNLSYEFQFIRKHLEWEKVFALDKRKVCYAVTKTGIEFRCSYILSGYSLEKLADNLTKYKISKMVGDLDYLKIRHSKTELTEKEIKYCVNDVLVIIAYIQERIEIDGGIIKIPLTKTGYVRNYCRNNCLYNGSHKKDTYKYHNYNKIMKSMKLEPNEYLQLKRAFQGGFVHASYTKSNKIIHNVGSADFTSSYPFVMCVEKFPMSKGEIVELTSKEEFYKYLNNYCCLFDIEFFNIHSKQFFEHPISSSRCAEKVKAVIDNGRIVSAEHILTTITECDYKVYEKFYSWDNIRIYNFRVYKKAYLPKDFILSLLKLYGDKTKLKDVEGMEVEYLASKEMINAGYGMAVTDICRDDINYSDNIWSSSKPDIEGKIDKYNNDKRRFLSYPWGVWVTAYARLNLFSGIYEFKEDYVYSDTDCVKGINFDNHALYFEKYNSMVMEKINNVCKYHNIDIELFKPKTIKNVEKVLGVWDYEGEYSRFKTLGAKRYITEKDGKISITVSGLNKKVAVSYLIKKYGDKIFENFKNDLFIPDKYTGKNTHTYIDDERKGIVFDYRGDSFEYNELSSVHLEGAEYHMSLSKEYIDYLLGYREYEK